MRVRGVGAGMTLATLRLPAAWATVAVFLFAGPAMIAAAGTAGAIALFLWLFAIVMWAAFGVVHEAEELAERLGEPFGTLILTLSIVIIEVALIAAAMLGGGAAATLGRDTMFAVLMIVLNGVVGVGLLLGGWKHSTLRFNLEGAVAYLAVIVPMCVIALVLPNFTISTARGTLSPWQMVAFSVFTVLLYGLFLWLQTGRHSGFFRAVDEDAPVGHALPHGDEAPHGSIRRHAALLLANILPIVILSKSLAKLLDLGIGATGAPVALSGVVIAMIVFTPEGISALRAIHADQLTRAVNLCLGAATSTLGLTVPAVLVIGLVTGTPVVLGLSAADMVLLATTLILSTLTFSGRRATMLEGAVHLTLFLVFLVLVFSP